MRSAISALAGFALAGSFAFAQPSEGHLKIIHETATLRVAYRADSRAFSYVDAQGRPVGYTIELCGEILGLYTKYLGGVGLGVSNWAGVVFMFGGLPE